MNNKIGLFVFLFLTQVILSQPDNINLGGIIYFTNNKYEADLIVFVISDADRALSKDIILIKITDNRYCNKINYWYITHNRYEAKFKVFVTHNRAEAQYFIKIIKTG